MNASDKRKTVVNRVKSREGKNSYTQSSKRDQVEDGYSDCSSLQHWAYLGAGMEIGTYTGAQIQKGSWVTQGGAYPDESRLLPGDELFFSAGYDNGRPHNVGHIEIYAGNGQISGHGSGIGPTRKNMIEYCKQRNASGKPYIGVKRYIENNVSTGNNDTDKPVKTMFTGECTGDDVNVRTGPGTSYGLAGWPKLNKGNLVDVLEKMGSWYMVNIQGNKGYVFAQYIKEYVASKPPVATDNTHTVKKGDTLSKVAKQWNVSVSEIASFNSISNPNIINIGQVIKKPSKQQETVPQPSGWNAINTATCTGNSVNVRSSPDMGNNILRRLDKGNRFEIDGQKQNGFHHIKVEGAVAWISSQYVRED